MRFADYRRIAHLIYFAGLLSFAIPSHAQTFELVDQQGIWSFYRAFDAPMTVQGHAPDRYDGICLAQSTIDGMTLQFTMLPPELHEIAEETGFVAAIHIYGDEWNFREQEAFAAISVEISSLGNHRARYSGDMISFEIIRDFQTFGIFMMFAGARGEIVVLDRDRRPLARFPTEGFPQIRDQLFTCAGM